jgi:hypothetical protein
MNEVSPLPTNPKEPDMATVPATTLTALFASAAEATSWKRTTLGLRTEIQHAGYAYTVQLPQDSGAAYIAGRSAWGNHECLYIEATLAETLPIVEAAMAATRVH